MSSGISIIGEAYVRDGAECAERMVAEAMRIWSQGDWTLETDNHGVVVESAPVEGVLAPAGIAVTRSRGDIGASAEATFEMLSSPEGFAVIDPYSDPADFRRPPLQTYPWRGGARLEASIAFTRIPLGAVREFVVLNAIDPRARIFASKSILHPEMPGGSRYSDQPSPPHGRVRALNTFVIEVQASNEARCEVRCINYIDMAGRIPAWAMNFLSKKWFFPPLYRRIGEAMGRRS